MNNPLEQYSLDFPFAYGEPSQRLDFRQNNEHFVVEEIMDIPLSGEGEHLWLHIKKNGENTQWVAEKLARFFSVKVNDVGYAGMKDRHAITSQWFSIYLPGIDHNFSWDDFLDQADVNTQLLDSGTHSQKLRRGMHRANRFNIVLGKVIDQQDLTQRLANIQLYGVPNYFGEQRFGRDAGNIALAVEWFTSGRPIRNRHKKGLAMSAARSYLFNIVLSARVSSKTWCELLSGDIDDVAYPSGPLWGRGRPLVSDETLEKEMQALENFILWCDQLEHCGLNQERRMLVLKPDNLSWAFDDSALRVSFELSAGEFATSVLRELAMLNNLRAHA